jgi:hypothetical protein
MPTTGASARSRGPRVDSADDLAAFQRALLELLGRPLSPEQIAAELRTGEAFAPYRAYVAGFEPRMVEVAAQLVKKWGRRRDGIS